MQAQSSAFPLFGLLRSRLRILNDDAVSRTCTNLAGSEQEQVRGGFARTRDVGRRIDMGPKVPIQLHHLLDDVEHSSGHRRCDRALGLVAEASDKFLEPSDEFEA